MRTSSFPFSLLILATGALIWGCGSPAGESASKLDAASGGDHATGGAMGTGGTIASGGMTATGGTADTTSSGGTVSSGGTKGTGGTTMTGGSVSTGGTSATGGATASGGTSAASGATGTGGSAATGGTVGSGGSPGGNSAKGGTTSTGGTKATGGSTGSGGSSVDAGAATKTIPGNGCTPPAAYANLFVSLSGHTQELRTIQGGFPRPWLGCRAGLDALGITSDGRVKGCLALPDACAEGNLREESLAAMWKDPDRFAYNRRYTPEQLGGKCADCEQAPLCRGGCTATAYAVHERPGKSVHCFRLHV